MTLTPQAVPSQGEQSSTQGLALTQLNLVCFWVKDINLPPLKCLDIVPTVKYQRILQPPPIFKILANTLSSDKTNATNEVHNGRPIIWFASRTILLISPYCGKQVE